MREADLLLQRALDGRLGPAENAAMRCMAEANPHVAAQAQALSGLDQLLRLDAIERRTVADQVTDQSSLRAQIMDRLPATAPAEHLSLRIGDIVLSAAIIGLIVMTYGTLGLVFDRSLLLVLLACISLVAGCGLLAFAGALRGDLPFLGMLLRHRVVVGSGDVLVYRAMGFAIAVGGVWLTLH